MSDDAYLKLVSGECGQRVAVALTDAISLARSKPEAARIALSVAAKAIAIAAGSLIAAKGLDLSAASFRAVAAQLAEDLVEEIGECIPAGYAKSQADVRGLQ